MFQNYWNDRNSWLLKYVSHLVFLELLTSRNSFNKIHWSLTFFRIADGENCVIQNAGHLVFQYCRLAEVLSRKYTGHLVFTEFLAETLSLKCPSNLVCLFLLTACWSCRYCKNLLVTLHTLYFLWRRMFHCRIIQFVLSEKYVTQLSQSNENAPLTSLHTSYIWCAVEPLLIIGMSSNDGAVSSESLLTCLTKMGKI